MALLFLKQKLFSFQAKPGTRPSRRVSDGDTIRDDFYHDDLETQHPGYDTFCDSAPRNGNAYREIPASVDADSDAGTGADADNLNSQRSKVNPRIVSDAILGLSDGLTVPFALSAGLSALGNTKVVVVGGLAELMAGAISMGLGGYVGAKSEAESYDTTVRDTYELIETAPLETTAIVHNTFAKFGLSEEAISQINASLHSSHERLLDFLVTFHHKESAPDCNQAWISAITLAVGYFVGGFIPLIPYFIASHVAVALNYSIGVMAITLLAFGYVKTGVVRGWSGRENVIAGIKGGVQMCFVGGAAAGAAIGLVRLIDQSA